jgi:predicted RNase H-like nuclease (RuvC/YqgF family)
VKRFKHLLKYRRIALDLQHDYDALDLELYRTKSKLQTAYSRYDDSIRHNVYLAKEIDNQYDMIRSLQDKLKETQNER